MKIKGLILMCPLVGLLSGCVLIRVPVPTTNHRVTNGKEIRVEDLAFVRQGTTTRHDVEQVLGEPWTFYPQIGVSVYYWESLRGYWFSCFGIAIPLGGHAGVSGGESHLEEITRMHVLLMQFDGQGCVKRYEIMQHPERRSTEDVATKWAGSAE
jgi:outer membrane protein assembly factor BamE (lipoprotein component of BamABCDE complex)